MPTTLNDGEILSDSFDVALRGQLYTVNSITLTCPIVEIGRNGIQGARAASRYIRDIGNASVELQISITAQNQDLQFAGLIVPASVTIDGVERFYLLTEATQNIASGTTRTRTFTARELQNFTDAMVVEGAGTDAANGIFLRDGDLNERPRYEQSADNLVYFDAIWWIGDLFPSPEFYVGSGNPLTPDLVLTWNIGPAGSTPSPTVRRLLPDDLQGAFFVKGAGTANVRRIFRRAGTASTLPRYVGYDKDGVTLIAELRATATDGTAWAINDDEGGPLYIYTGSASLTPPLTGWVLAGGDSPAPTIEAVSI